MPATPCTAPPLPVPSVGQARHFSNNPKGKRMADEKQFKPFVPDDAQMAEFTPKAIVLGVAFGIVFGAATVFLALKAGLTVSASIPIAVLAIAVFKRIGNSTILENNMVQTIGSASESIAAGVVFTIPALLFLAEGEQFFTYFNIFALSIVGGFLGILLMVPLRRALIVKEHGVLPYPEGTACADVLIAGEKGGSLAKRVFAGLGAAVGYRFFMNVLGFWNENPEYVTGSKAALPKMKIDCGVTPEYLGVGYIIGPKIAGELTAGGVLSQLVLVPLIAIFGEALTVGIQPTAGKIISVMSADEIRGGFVKYIGAGAVAAAGLITLISTLPTIVSAFRDSFKSLREGAAGVKQRRTEKDLSIKTVIFGTLILVAIIALLPQLPGDFGTKLLMGLLVVVFGFFFVTVSSRIVGIIGTSSNPVSGMTIATLMGTCLIFVALGWTGQAYQAIALCVGGMVCIAASNAGNTSQDLKTGYIVGATPRSQQIGLMIGVAASVLSVGITMHLLDSSMKLKGIEHAIGTAEYSAPQATLMATIIKGLLAQDLPWGLVFCGMGIALVVQMCGVRALSFAVGLYLPLGTTLPIFVGGMLRWWVDRNRGEEESELSPGMLYATGLVAGGALTGVLIAVTQGVSMGEGADGKAISLAEWMVNKVGVQQLLEAQHLWAGVIPVLAFSALGFLLLRTAKQKD